MKFAHSVEPRSISNGRKSELGAALVEFAIVSALLVPLVFGVLEYGFLFRYTNEAVNASRTGARSAAGYRDNKSADYFTLSSIKADLVSSNMLSQLTRVVIYKSTNVTRPPATCLTGSSGACQIYNASIFATLNETNFGTNGCYTGTGVVLNGFCSTSRNIDSYSPDIVGVAILLDGKSITGITSTHKIMKYSAMRIEPLLGN